MTTSCPTVIANHDAFRQSVPYTGPQQCETSKNRGILGFFSLPKRRNFKGSKPVPPIRALSYGPSHPSARDCAGLSATKSRFRPCVPRIRGTQRDSPRFSRCVPRPHPSTPTSDRRRPASAAAKRRNSNDFQSMTNGRPQGQRPSRGTQRRNHPQPRRVPQIRGAQRRHPGFPR